MTPQEKASELVEKFYMSLPMLNSYEDAINESKKCALITVDEILLATSIITVKQSHHRAEEIEYSNYWQEVKEELEKLTK